MAMTPWPTFRLSESPMVAMEIWLMVSAGMFSRGTATTARSFSTSVPLILASTAWLSMNTT